MNFISQPRQRAQSGAGPKVPSIRAESRWSQGRKSIRLKGSSTPPEEGSGMTDRTIEELDEAESLRLISRGEIGRIAYASRFGPAVLPVNYRWHDGAIVFRTAR